MSFDLKIKNGDLVIGTNGDLDRVENTEKLIQDLLKILLTPIGSNHNYQWYGSPLSRAIIGTAMDLQFLSLISQNHIRTAVETIQNLQREQMKNQKVSASELIAAIKDTSILQNQIDPTFWQVNVAILTKALTTANVSFDVSL